MGLPPEEIVFVDDLGFNLKPARELGMATVLHMDAASTIAELEQILGVDLRAESEHMPDGGSEPGARPQSPRHRFGARHTGMHSPDLTAEAADFFRAGSAPDFADDRGEIDGRFLAERLAVAAAQQLVAARGLGVAAAPDEHGQQVALDLDVVGLELGEAVQLLRRALEVALRPLAARDSPRSAWAARSRSRSRSPNAHSA